MKAWLETYDRYMKILNEGRMYQGNTLERLKLIYKNIYLSPLDFGDLFFDIGRKIQVANEIKVDIKNVFDENAEFNSRNQKTKVRIKFSRLMKDIKYFKHNCQVGGI